MAGLNIVSFRPQPSDYAWTFGGVEPVMKVKPGDVLEVWTEDCFAGLVQTVDDNQADSGHCPWPRSAGRSRQPR